ncbi:MULTISPECIES: hypothetical protein [Novilysobacter]|uniref:hypothetical protein n=1 Tax=Novilysobacter TaxID=3382699 RepID=UPI002EDA2958
MRPIVIVIFVAAACLLWWPFHTQTSLYNTGSAGSTPAGEILARFVLEQTVRPGADQQVRSHEGQQHCFGIRFATYMRTNGGRLDVRWRQGDRHQQWRVNVAGLADNKFRYFCPDDAFAAEQDFDLRISGVDGQPGNAATLWLVDDTRLGTARLGGDAVADKALALEVTTRERIGIASMIRVNAGAFAFGWVCTLLVGVVALRSAFAPAR